MAGTIWFGNTEKFVPIPAPRTAASAPLVGRSAVLQLANGGAIVEDSLAQHREHNWEWVGDPAAHRIIQEFMQGAHGPGPFYWIDPFAAEANLFPPNWATPRMIGVGDWKELYDTAGTNSAQAVGNYGLPAVGRRYVLPAGPVGVVPRVRFTIMIPPTHTLYLGASGAGHANGAVGVRPYNLSGASLAIDTRTPLSPTGATRYFPGSYPGTVYSRVEVFLTRTTSTGNAVAIINHMVAKLVRSNTAPFLESTYVSGEGSTGLRFTGGMTQTLHTSGGYGTPARKGFAVKLVETEAWEL